MHKTLVLAGAAIILGAAVWLGFFAATQKPTPSPGGQPNATSTGPWLCTGDGKICPDGSTVGRTGPSCEFAACPSPTATSSTQTTYLGGRATGLNLTINPREIVSDSRCAQGVQCIWAGTVEVRAAVETQVAHGEHVFKLGEPRTVGNVSVTLTEVTPYPIAGTPIPESSYRFTFLIQKL